MRGTTGCVYLSSLPNVRGQGTPERHVCTRDIEKLQSFATRWDRAERGLFFCVSTIAEGKPRKKENTVETPVAHVDVDLKSVDATFEEVLVTLGGLTYPPSRIHASGHGLHAYWYLASSQPDHRDRTETLCKYLQRALSGDRSVAHCAALMRLPGSHNTKEGQWLEVTVARDGGEIYAIEDLEFWAQRLMPLIRPKISEEIETNPFLQAAADQGFSPPVDVLRRLTEMSAGGAGDAAVHPTQLSCTASLLASGHEVDEVVEIVMVATRRAGEGLGWDWGREERTIRGMCDDFLRKHPRRGVEDPPSEVIVDLGAARAERAVAERPPIRKIKPHAVLGAGILGMLEQRGEKMLRVSDRTWRYRDGLWSALSPADARAWIEREAEEGCLALGVSSAQKLISETVAWLYRHADVSKEDVEWDAHGMIPVRNGMLDATTGSVRPATHEDMCTYQIQTEYSADAACPLWEQMLMDCFSNKTLEQREGSIAQLQEAMGMALVEKKPRVLRKALILHGPAGTGKSTILNVMSRILANDANATPFDMLENAHGLAPFLRRAPWVLHEAFDQSKWHFSSVVKALLSGDPVSANIKNGPMVTFEFVSPVLWGTNHPPQFKEASKAIVERILMVAVDRVFESSVGVDDVARRRGFASAAELILDGERPGVLNWALGGMRRAQRQGVFTITAESREAAHQVRMDSNIISGFLEECVDFDPACKVSSPDFCCAFALWWSAVRGEDRRTPSNDSVGRAVRALSDNRISFEKTRLKRFFVGVKLNEVGLDYWAGASGSNLPAGRMAGLAASVSSVNEMGVLVPSGPSQQLSQ